MPDNPRFMATAIDIVLRAGEIQLAGLSRHLDVRKKGAIDLVTEVDLAVERMCRDVLAERFPSHAIEAEEFGQTSGDSATGLAPDSHRYCWIFDPLDGTTNYAHGLPIFCSACSLECNGQPIVGAIYDPSRRELFTAERGLGAWLNGAPLRVSKADALIDSLLCTGFPYSVREDRSRHLQMFGAFLAETQGVRRLGSAALDLCYVAAGRLDGYWEETIHPWDIAAGGLIVLEAGGAVTGVGGEPFDAFRGHVMASNGRLHEAMLAVEFCDSIFQHPLHCWQSVLQLPARKFTAVIFNEEAIAWHQLALVPAAMTKPRRKV